MGAGKAVGVGVMLEEERLEMRQSVFLAEQTPHLVAVFSRTMVKLVLLYRSKLAGVDLFEPMLRNWLRLTLFPITVRGLTTMHIP